MAQYLGNTVRCVGADNRTTAVLYIPEMTHMPQKEVMGAVIAPLLLAALFWRRSPNDAPLRQLSAAGRALEQLGFASRLLYTGGPGQWQEMQFGPQTPDTPAKPLSPRAPKPPRQPPVVPLGTAPAVLPMATVAALTPEKHRELAAQALREADALAVQARHPEEVQAMRQRLLEFAAGQEGDAYAAEGDSEGKQSPKPAPQPSQPQYSAHAQGPNRMQAAVPMLSRGSGHVQAPPRAQAAAPVLSRGYQQVQPQSAPPIGVHRPQQVAYAAMPLRAPYPSQCAPGQVCQTPLPRHNPVHAPGVTGSGALWAPMLVQTPQLR